MRKFLILSIFVLICGALSAQTYNFKATELAIRYHNGYAWEEWSDWQPVSIQVKMDLDASLIIIYSNRTQIYRITEYDGSYTDSSQGNQMRFTIIDQDYDRGHLRLRVEKNGNSQIYVDFSDVMWVYNVVRI